MERTRNVKNIPLERRTTVKDSFVKVATVTPKLRVADIDYNREQLLLGIHEAATAGGNVIVTPELCITGYSCRDLFFQTSLLEGAKESLLEIAKQTCQLNAIIVVGLPIEHKGKLYNVAGFLSKGTVLGLVPKTYLPNYHEFYEARQFCPGMSVPEKIALTEEIETYIGTKQLFCCKELPQLRIAAEICEDLWTPNPPSVAHCLNGATVIVNLSASDEITGKSEYRRELVAQQSARLYCGYLYASASWQESTQDVVYSGHSMIAETGTILKEMPLFSNGVLTSEIDLERIQLRRMDMNTFELRHEKDYKEVAFSLTEKDITLTRYIDPAPFVPSDANQLKKRCEEILWIQSMGLAKRLQHTKAKVAVVGISGGLDSTLALLVTVRAFEALNLDLSGIVAVTMPGFGTTDRTYDNAITMMKELGVTIREIPIAKAVLQHFEDIGHNKEVLDVTYENAQARERTQILMDIANKEGGLVIGTGDMSELALGWATYNGDHMSMYGVNVSVPKTLVRYLVSYYANYLASPKLKDVLEDVLDTPVSPELLPPKEGEIAQKTEELVGPYELHDFFLYYVMRFGFSPTKIFRLAKIAFEQTYDAATILKWEKTFYHRFFAQQFKRSCMPDGPKVGTVALSPRGDLRMPTDACGTYWLKELDKITIESH